MIKTYLTIALLGIVSICTAQKIGTVTYKEVQKIEIQIDGLSEEMASMIPKERTTNSVLSFNEKYGFMTTLKSKNENQNIEQEVDGARFVIRRDEPENKTFFDLNNNKCFDQREFMGKKFLIESDLKTHTWKITGQQKEIAGYPCLEAELTNSETKNKVMAWFCPSLPVSIGPLALGNLPGLILAVNINNGESLITAEKIELGSIDEKVLVKPTEGKKVSKKEFREIVDAKRKEMQEENGGEGNVVIKIRN